MHTDPNSPAQRTASQRLADRAMADLPGMQNEAKRLAAELALLTKRRPEVEEADRLARAAVLAAGAGSVLRRLRQDGATVSLAEIGQEIEANGRSSRVEALVLAGWVEATRRTEAALAQVEARIAEGELLVAAAAAETPSPILAGAAGEGK